MSLTLSIAVAADAVFSLPLRLVSVSVAAAVVVAVVVIVLIAVVLDVMAIGCPPTAFVAVRRLSSSRACLLALCLSYISLNFFLLPVSTFFFFVRSIYSRLWQRHRNRIVGFPPRGGGALAMEIDVGERGESAMALDERPQPLPRREIFPSCYIFFLLCLIPVLVCIQVPVTYWPLALVYCCAFIFLLYSWYSYVCVGTLLCCLFVTCRYILCV